MTLMCCSAFLELDQKSGSDASFSFSAINFFLESMSKIFPQRSETFKKGF